MILKAIHALVGFESGTETIPPHHFMFPSTASNILIVENLSVPEEGGRDHMIM